MFEVLIEKLNSAFKNLTNKGRLSEKEIDEGLRQIRLALLEADVNYKVVKVLLEGVRQRALGITVLQSLTPGQQIIKIINEELIRILGVHHEQLQLSAQSTSAIMLVGLQGAGKTTTAAKLAAILKLSGHYPLLVAADTRRPAAVNQLEILGKQMNVPVYTEYGIESPISICNHAMKRASELAASIVIFDTQGRLHIDEPLMLELKQIKNHVKCHEVLLVVDAMTGQDSVRIAEEFNRHIGVTGLILTKMDGDSRGGAALSIRYVTGIPIKYIGTGEKTNALDIFYPDRMASRIMGKGDVLSLIEKAEKSFNQQQTKKLEDKFRRAEFDLGDFLEHLKQLKNMGPLNQIIQLLPGVPKLPTSLLDGSEEKQLKKLEAIVLSMTPAERAKPEIINGTRRKRIASGSGTTSHDVNQLLSQFTQMKKIAKIAAQGKLPKKFTDTFRK